jgi:hypothetical protein
MSKKTDSLAVVPIEKPGDLLAVIANAVADPRMDVDKMQRLLDMHMQITTDQRRVEFDEAMTRLQKKIPQIEKYGQGKNSKFAKYEDIDAICKPLWIEEGFNLAFSEESRTERAVTFALKVSRAGHSETFRLTVQTDVAAQNREGRSVRPAIQDDGSTASYARRYLTQLALNIVAKNEDTDGESLKLITEEQARDIESAMQEVKMDKGRFLVFMGVGEVKDILARDLKKAINAIDVKRQSVK